MMKREKNVLKYQERCCVMMIKDIILMILYFAGFIASVMIYLFTFVIADCISGFTTKK